MAEAPKKRRSVIISRALPPIPPGPEAVIFDRPEVKYIKPKPAPATVEIGEAEVTRGSTWAERQRLQKEEREATAQIVKDEIAADEAMKARRL